MLCVTPAVPSQEWCDGSCKSAREGDMIRGMRWLLCKGGFSNLVFCFVFLQFQGKVTNQGKQDILELCKVKVI